MKNKKLTVYIFVSLILGILFGGFFPELGVKTQFLATHIQTKQKAQD